MTWAISHFHYYLYGYCITAYTDHSTVKAVLEMTSPSGQHDCWWTRVYNNGVKQVTVVHHAEWDSVAADALSQYPICDLLKGDTAVDKTQVVTVKSILPTTDQVLKV